MNPNAVGAIENGGLAKLFGHATTDEAIRKKYNPTVHSRDPWVVTFDNFVTDEEVDALLKTNEGMFERSSDAGRVLPDGSFERVTSQSRTSSNAWCNHDKCMSNTLVQQLERRIANITQFPVVNQEFFQASFSSCPWQRWWW